MKHYEAEDLEDLVIVEFFSDIFEPLTEQFTDWIEQVQDDIKEEIQKNFKGGDREEVKKFFIKVAKDIANKNTMYKFIGEGRLAELIAAFVKDYDWDLNDEEYDQ